MTNAREQTVSAVKVVLEHAHSVCSTSSDTKLTPGTPEFFGHIRPWMNPFKFPWIMQRIDQEAACSGGKHLLEIGCGMGYDSLEFLKRA